MTPDKPGVVGLELKDGSDMLVRCSACGTPHGSIEGATVCCERFRGADE